MRILRQRAIQSPAWSRAHQRGCGRVLPVWHWDDQMKRIFFSVVSLFVAAVCLAQIAEPKRALAATKQPQAVVILQCQGGSNPATYVVAVDASINSPSINTGGVARRRCCSWCQRDSR
jgi:hypothetical protein